MWIYIMDYEPIVVNTLQSFLRDLGHEVSSFQSIEDLLNHQENTDASPDLIIVDLNMPIESAIRTINEIHTRHTDTALLIMSSVLPSREAISNGVYSYLHKPLRFNELELLLARIDERHERQMSTTLQQRDILTGYRKNF